MQLKDMLSPQFKDWVLEIYDEKEQLLISTYELDLDGPVWKNFVKRHAKDKVIKTEPTEVTEFMNIIIQTKTY